MAGPSRTRARHLVALDHRRREALKIAKTNCAVGSGYNAAMGQWLRDNGLDGVTPLERYRVILCIENLAMIEQWRAGLDDAQRRRLNHPNQSAPKLELLMSSLTRPRPMPSFRRRWLNTGS